MTTTAWNETDPAARERAVAELDAADARYVDPLVDAAGREAIAATIGAVQGQFPGFAFRLVGPVDAHHYQARFRWEFGPAGAPEAPVAGFEYLSNAMTAGWPLASSTRRSL